MRVAVRLVSRSCASRRRARTWSSDAGGSETVRFPAELRSTGRFQVDVHLLSPNGRVIGRESLVVRSTAYNRIALFITIGAAVVLLGLWARRFVRAERHGGRCVTRPDPTDAPPPEGAASRGRARTRRARSSATPS